MSSADETTTLPFRTNALVTTAPFLDSREALEALLFARTHDALRALTRWLSGGRRLPVDGFEGRLMDGRLFRIIRLGHSCALWIYPDDAAVKAHDACRAQRPFSSQDLRYLYAAQSPVGGLEPRIAEALTTAGVDIENEGGVVVRRCVSFGEAVTVRPADLLDIMNVLGFLLARSETTAKAA